MASPVRVQLLGPVRAVGAKGPLALRGKTARTVLARLALSAGSVVSVDQLADALWDDDPPLAPAVSLRSIVSRLRTQLGADAIATDGAGYRLDPTLVAVDLAEIETAMKDGRLQQREPEELGAMLELWDGDALIDVAWTPTFEPERARIAEIRARLVDCYHNAMLGGGWAAEALADLERDAAAAPLREPTQLLLMRTLDACGRTADALRAGEAYRARLIDQTGVDPTADYDALTRVLLEPHDRPQSSALAEKPARANPRAGGRTWIPPDTPLVGREAELADLARIAQQRRLVTVTGPGGVGKTRLVTEFMSRDTDAAKARVEMVSLAALDRSSAVETAVATAIGLEVSSANTVQALTERLSAQTSTLVLDNCEHVLSSARALVQHLLRSVEHLQIITTSRRRLALSDEAILDLGPLELPATNTVDSAPMRLFIDRVERAAPNLAFSDRDKTVAADICRLVEGLPLALELAAARVPMFGFDGLRQRLLDGLAVPGGQTHDDERRQATIESTVEWSLALLSPAARKLFDDLSVFPSWFDLASLEQVSANPQAIDAFSEIHDSSLVTVDHGRPAYRLLEPVRQVARRQIDQAHHAEIVTRYTAWIATIIDTIDRHWIDDDDRAAAQHLIIQHRADIRWTLNHLIEQGDAGTHGHLANVLAKALAERADIELIDLCRIEVGQSLEGELARLVLAWNQGDHDTSARLAHDIGLEIGPEHELWGYYNWARIPVHLYHGETAELVEAAAIAVADPRAYASMRSEAVGLWACGLLYSGRREGAAAVLADNEHILRLSASGGFVAYTRAEIIAAHDPELAIEYLSTSSSQAIAANGPFTQRLTDVSQLVLLIAGHDTHEAAGRALRLLPELIQAGTYPQAWTAMRHVADLLGQLDAPATGLLVLDSANAAPAAPAVTGEAIQAEKQLRTRLEALAAEIGDDDRAPPSTLVPLWEQVEPILDRGVRPR